MSPLPCISSLPSIHVFLLQNEACLSMLLTQRQGRIKKSGKEEEDSTWLKGCMYCWDYAWTTGWTEGEKDEDKCHDHSPGQHHISVVHLEIYTKEKHSLHWASLPFQLRGQEKVRKQRCHHDSRTELLKGSQQWLSGQSLCWAGDPELPLKHTQFFTLVPALRSFSLYKTAGNLVLK